MQIKIYTEVENIVYGFNIESASLKEDKIIIEGGKNRLVIRKDKSMIFESSDGTPSLNIKNVQINGVDYGTENFDKLKKLLF